MDTTKLVRDRDGDVPTFDGVTEDPASGRTPSLEAQTPGLDTEREARTLRDAKVYYAGEAGDHPAHGTTDPA